MSARALIKFTKANRQTFNNLAPAMGSPFIGVITKVNNESETVEVAHHAGKNNNLQVLHPYIGTNSFHRVGVETGQQLLLQIRSGTKKPEASAYYQSSGRPEETTRLKLNAYKEAKGLYRPLSSGEQDLLSSGTAELFLSSRAQADVRGGYVRSWWDQDALEAGTRAVTHTRQLHLNNKKEMGDEERFGAVQRPDDLTSNPSQSTISSGVGAATSAGSMLSGGVGQGPAAGTPSSAAAKSVVWSKIIDAPAGTALPNAPVNASAASDPVAAATVAATSALQQVDPAKEYVRILKTKSGMLIDHREGHVVDLDGTEIQGKFSAPLRVQRKIYGSAGSGSASTITTMSATAASEGSGTATWEEQIDANGNWYVGLPQTADQGIKFEIPAGKFEVKSGTTSSSLTLDGTQNLLKLISSATAEITADQEVKVKSQKVKLGQTDAAIHKAVLTQIYKAGEQGTFTGLLGAQSAEGIVHTAASAGINVLSSIFMVVSVLPLTPGAIVGVMAKAESLIPTIFHTVLPVLKNLKGGFGGVFAGAWDTYESQNVELS